MSELLSVIFCFLHGVKVSWEKGYWNFNSMVSCPFAEEKSETHLIVLFIIISS